MSQMLSLIKRKCVVNFVSLHFQFHIRPIHLILCIICSKIIPRNTRKHSNTVWCKFQEDIEINFAVIEYSYSFSVNQTLSLEHLLQSTANFIALSLKPVSVVDEPSFRSLLAKTDARFELRYRRTHFGTKVIPEMYFAVRSRIEEKLREVNCCTITTDLWTAGTALI